MKDLRIKISKSGATIAIVYIDQSKCINGRNTGELVKRLQALAKIGKQKLRSIMNIQKDGILIKLTAAILKSLVITILIIDGLFMVQQSMQDD